MTLQEKLASLDPVIGSKQYPYFRLLDEVRVQIIPAKRTVKQRQNEIYFGHWKFIKHALIHDLPVGKYIFQCFYDSGGKTYFDYEIIKSDADIAPVTPVILNTESFEKTTTEKTPKMTDKEIMDLVRENERLMSDVKILDMTVKQLREQVAELESELSESESLNDESNTGINGAMSAITPVIPLLEKWMEQNDRKLALMEKKINQNSRQKSLSPANALRPLVKRKALQEQDPYIEIRNYIDGLFTSDEAKANQELDVIQSQDPDTYKRLVTDLNLEDDGQENDNQD